ncbi:MAG: LCP family protein [Acidimicrobiales bacterium]
MPADLPPIPGRSRAVYTVGGKEPRRFGRRRRARFDSPSGSSRKTYQARGRPAGRRWLRRILIALSVLIPLVLVAGIAGYVDVKVRLDSIPKLPVPALTPEKSGQPIDILLVGSDSRDLSCAKTAAGVKAFGSSSTTTGQRSDVIIVVRLIPSTDTVEMLSIPRDTWVPIAGTGGSDKINAAFNNGPNQLVQTIQDNFHIPINHVMIANFCGFEGMVNSLGGISLDFRYPVRDAYSGLRINTTGCQLINGTQALALVRSRHLYYFKHGAWNYDGLSDWSRIRRQQAFFHALLNKVHGVFPNVFELNSFLGATVSDLTVDSSFGGGELISLGLKYHSLSESNLITSVLPTYSQVIDGQDALITAQPYANNLIRSFLARGTTPVAPGSSKASAGSSPKTTTTTGSTVPPAGVVTDTPQSDPEPWNPTPC